MSHESVKIGTGKEKKMSNDNVPIMLGLREAAERSGLSYSALRLMCIRDEIVHVRVGKKFLVNWARLVEYLGGVPDEENQDAVCQG